MRIRSQLKAFATAAVVLCLAMVLFVVASAMGLGHIERNPGLLNSLGFAALDAFDGGDLAGTDSRHRQRT